MSTVSQRALWLLSAAGAAGACQADPPPAEPDPGVQEFKLIGSNCAGVAPIMTAGDGVAYAAQSVLAHYYAVLDLYRVRADDRPVFQTDVPGALDADVAYRTWQAKTVEILADVGETGFADRWYEGTFGLLGVGEANETCEPIPPESYRRPGLLAHTGLLQAGQCGVNSDGDPRFWEVRPIGLLWIGGVYEVDELLAGGLAERPTTPDHGPCLVWRSNAQAARNRVAIRPSPPRDDMRFDLLTGCSGIDDDAGIDPPRDDAGAPGGPGWPGDDAGIPGWPGDASADWPSDGGPSWPGEGGPGGPGWPGLDAGGPGWPMVDAGGPGGPGWDAGGPGGPGSPIVDAGGPGGPARDAGGPGGPGGPMVDAGGPGGPARDAGGPGGPGWPGWPGLDAGGPGWPTVDAGGWPMVDAGEPVPPVEFDGGPIAVDAGSPIGDPQCEIAYRRQAVTEAVILDLPSADVVAGVAVERRAFTARGVEPLPNGLDSVRRVLRSDQFAAAVALGWPTFAYAGYRIDAGGRVHHRVALVGHEAGPLATSNALLRTEERAHVESLVGRFEERCCAGGCDPFPESRPGNCASACHAQEGRCSTGFLTDGLVVVVTDRTFAECGGDCPHPATDPPGEQPTCGE